MYLFEYKPKLYLIKAVSVMWLIMVLEFFKVMNMEI